MKHRATITYGPSMWHLRIDGTHRGCSFTKWGAMFKLWRIRLFSGFDKVVEWEAR